MDDEIEVIKKDTIEIYEQNSQTNIIKDCFIDSDLVGISLEKILNEIIKGLDIADIISKIEKNKEYVVRVPYKFKKAYEQGKVFVMQNKDTGALRPMLAKWNKNGKYEIVSHMEMIEKNVVSCENAVQDIVSRWQYMALQQQISKISEVLEQAHEVVRRIEQGQHNDRIGLINAGRDQIMIAVSNSENIDMDELKNGRNNLYLGCAQIFETLCTMANDFPEIHEKRIMRIYKLYKDPNYYCKIDALYELIEDCYYYYLEGIKMLAASYAICGEFDKVDLVFEKSKNKVSQIDFAKVEKIAFIHPNETDWISSNAVTYLESEKEILLEDIKEYDMISLKVNGDVLLEAFNNG